LRRPPRDDQFRIGERAVLKIAVDDDTVVPIGQTRSLLVRQAESPPFFVIGLSKSRHANGISLALREPAMFLTTLWRRVSNTGGTKGLKRSLPLAADEKSSAS